MPEAAAHLDTRDPSATTSGVTASFMVSPHTTPTTTPIQGGSSGALFAQGPHPGWSSYENPRTGHQQHAYPRTVILEEAHHYNGPRSVPRRIRTQLTGRAVPRHRHRRPRGRSCGARRNPRNVATLASTAPPPASDSSFPPHLTWRQTSSLRRRTRPQNPGSSFARFRRTRVGRGHYSACAKRSA